VDGDAEFLLGARDFLDTVAILQIDEADAGRLQDRPLT